MAASYTDAPEGRLTQVTELLRRSCGAEALPLFMRNDSAGDSAEDVEKMRIEVRQRLTQR